MLAAVILKQTQHSMLNFWTTRDAGAAPDQMPDIILPAPFDFLMRMQVP
jgi:hypothetical protein